MTLVKYTLYSCKVLRHLYVFHLSSALTNKVRSYYSKNNMILKDILHNALCSEVISDVWTWYTLLVLEMSTGVSIFIDFFSN